MPLLQAGDQEMAEWEGLEGHYGSLSVCFVRTRNHYTEESKGECRIRSVQRIVCVRTTLC